MNLNQLTPNELETLTNQQLDDYLSSLIPCLNRYASAIAYDKRDLGFDRFTAEEWVQEALSITFDASRTKIRSNVMATLRAKIRGLASNAIRVEKRRRQLYEANEHVILSNVSIWEPCSPDQYMTLIDRWNEEN